MNTKRRPNKITRVLICRLRRFNLFTRLLLVFCVLLISSTMFITFFNQNNYGREMESGLQQYLSVLVQNASFKLEQEKGRFEDAMSNLLHNDEFLQLVADNRVLQERIDAGDEEANQQYLENTEKIEQTLLSAKRRKNGIRALVLAAGNAQYSTSSGTGDPSRTVIRDLSEFHNASIYTLAVGAQGYPVWLDSVKEVPELFYESEEHNLGIEGCVTLSYQVYEPNSHKPLGVLVCCVSPKFLTQALSEYSSQNGGNTFIVGNNGMVEGIYAGFSAPPFIEQRAGLLRRIFTQHQGSMPLEVQGDPVHVSFCGPYDFPLHIVNLTYRDQVLEKVHQLGKLNLCVLGLVVLIGIGGFYLAAVSISYPVNKLISAMKRVGAGDFSAVYQSECHDEIGVLCDEFDRMVGDMKSLIDRVYVAELRERDLELNEKSAQLDALQMQINPHFLYNTLDMIRWECLYEAGGESAASDMIEKFCTLLRMTIKGDQKKESVQDSLLHASTYLEVINFRHTNKIQLDTQLSFDPTGYQIPCLTLQPILENAVRHGFAGEERPDSRILITGALTQDNALVLQISDNGKGMDQQQLQALRQRISSQEMTKDSIGLRNVNKRCQLYYGADYGLQVDSELGKGTIVTLTVPMDRTL